MSLDATHSPDRRAAELLSRMTHHEKAAQLVSVLATTLKGFEGITDDGLRRHLGNGIGHLAGAGVQTGDPAQIAALNDRVQRFLVDETRLGIPAILHVEALNGVVAEGFSSFPTPIGLAATFDTESVHEMADLIRRQMRAVGIRQALAPVLDIARDARWGRVHETFGEDVLLTSAMGVAYVSGIQGEDLREGVLATAKHFVAYSLTEGGQNMGATHLGPRELRDVYAAPFEAAIRIAAMRSVMNSYSEIDGDPVATSRAILTDLLRTRLGFTGSVVSDYRSLFYVEQRQQAVSGTDEAARLGLAAGLDVELPGEFSYGAPLADLLARGGIDEELVDTAVLRVLTHKFELGLFEDPYARSHGREAIELGERGRDLSRRLATRSLTLLTNEGGLLPLSESTRKIAVVGPHADSVLAGFANYTHPPVLEMLKGLATGKSRMAGMEAMTADLSDDMRQKIDARMARMAELDPEGEARDRYGAVSIAEALRDAIPAAEVVTAPGTGVRDSEPSDIPAAVAAAAGSEVVVVALGGRSAAFEGRATEGEGSDSATLQLPSKQLELLAAVKELGCPVVVVLYTGRPYHLVPVEELADAVLLGYYPGPEGGRAVADVLLGRAEPSGRLPYSIPRHVGQVPIYHSQKRGSGYRRYDNDMFTGYVDLEATPLHPFGHGLGYADVAYEHLDLGAPPVSTSGTVRATVTVRNLSQRQTVETVQLYVGVPATGVTRPAQQLAGFARVALQPGDAARAQIEIDVEQLGFTSLDGRVVVEPGTLRFWAGGSSADLPLAAEIEMEGEVHEVAAPRSSIPRVTVLPA